MTTTPPQPTATTPSEAIGNAVGPLTAIYTPDAQCAEGELYNVAGCYPGPYPLPELPYFSPAICPSGMTAAVEGNGGIGASVGVGETAVICCRSGFTYGEVANFNHQYNRYCTLETSTKLRAFDEETTLTTLSHMVVEVRWAETDLPDLETVPTVPDSAVVTDVAIETLDGGGYYGDGDDDMAMVRRRGAGGPGLSEVGKWTVVGIVVGFVGLVVLVGAVIVVMRKVKRRRVGEAGEVEKGKGRDSSESEDE